MGCHQQPGPLQFAFLLLVSTIFLTDARECKINCQGSAASGSLLKFEPGKVYNYRLEGQSVTLATGATGEASSLGLTADVQISHLSSCEHALKVTNVHTFGQDGKKHSLSSLSQEPVKFGLRSGQIEPELCATQTEDHVGLNIKRAVLSMVQSSALKENGFATQTEIDVFGSCPTGFEFSKSGGSVRVVKSRDLGKCAHREEITLPFLTTPYYVQSDFQASPLLTSSLRSEQKIEGGTLKSAQLEEQYDYRPSSVPENVAKITIKTTLKFVSSAPGAIPAACTVPRSIIFEQEHAQEGPGISNKIVGLVKEGAESRIVGRGTAEKFSQLVRAVAVASKADINQALQHIKSGPGIKERNTAQKMLLDAILMAQSGSSVEVMADILKKKEVTGNSARVWLLGLGAVKHASRSSLLAVLPLLDGEPDINAYLGIGSLAGKYCREHACEGVNEINQLQIKLGAPLLKGCKVGSKKQEDEIIGSLKGLGNIKYLGPKIAGKIAECAADEKVRTRIRVAALDTIATDPHKDVFKTLAIDLLKKTYEDSEIRIKAYQVLVKCPCGKVAAVIKDLLATEGSNQVGGYIVSHLRNLHASTNPDKSAAKHYLGNIIPPRRFIIDPKRYSVNQELSYSNGLVNSGASGELDLLYSQNSYIPRSVSLNLTTQVFGTAYNFLEIDLRAENLEEIVEGAFGPKGFFQSNDVDDLIDSGRRRFSHVLEKIAARYDKTVRPKRSLSRDQLDKLAQKVQMPVSGDDIDLDLSVKVLGAEVGWSHFHGSDVVPIDNIIDNNFANLDSFIHALKNTDVDYRKHFTLSDREITYPTGLGLAFRLRSLSTAAIRVKLDGKIDIPAIMRDPENADIKFQLIPSAAINVGGEIVIDGVAVETGIRMDLNVHTSTGSDISLRLLNGQGVDIKVGLPLPKQELISVKTDYTSIIRDDQQNLIVTPLKFETPRQSYSGCFDQLNPLLGLTFCGDIDVPYEQGKPIFPFHGPVSMAVSIDKEDESLTSYHFKTYYHKTEEGVHGFEVLLDTPNSKSSRKLSFNFEGSTVKPEKFVSVAVTSPWTSASLNAFVTKTPVENSLNVKLDLDGAEYSAKLGAKIAGSGSGKTKYEPIFEYKAPEPVKGALIGKKGGPKQKSQSIVTSGSVLVESTGNRHRYTFQGLSIKTPANKYTIDGFVVTESKGIEGDLRVSYEKEHITVKGKLREIAGELRGNLEISPSQYPDLGISLSLDSIGDLHADKYDLKLILVHGPDPKSTTSRIYIHHHSDGSFIRKIKNIGNLKFLDPPSAFSSEITYPVIGLETSLKAALSKKEISGGLKAKLDKYSVRLGGGILKGEKAAGDFAASLDAEFMGQELLFQSSRSVEGSDKSRFTNLLILKPGGTYQANALVTHRIASESDIDLSIDAEATIPTKAAIKLDSGYKRSGAKSASSIKLYLGDQCFIDGAAELSRVSPVEGSFKLSLPGYLETQGKLTADGSKANGGAQLYLPKADRKMEVKGDMVVKSPKFSGLFTVSYDTKDPKKTFKIQTDTDLNVVADGQVDLDSKNSITHGDTSIQVNAKGKSNGKILNAITSGEVEVILPNGYHAGAKFHEKFNFESSSEMEGHLEVWDKPRGEEAHRLELSAVGKHIDIRRRTLDGQASLSYTTRDKKNIHAHITAKKLPTSDGKSSHVALEVGTKGSLIDFPVAFKLESDVSNEYFDLDESLSLEDDLPSLNVKFSGSVGDEIKFDGVGKAGKPSSLQISATLPQSGPIKKFKLSSTALIDIGDKDSKEKSKVKVTHDLHWNENKFAKIQIEGEREEDGVKYEIEYETDNIPKTKVDLSAYLKAEQNLKGGAKVTIESGKKKNELSVKGEVSKDKTDSSLQISANAPSLLEASNIDIHLKNKVVKEGKGFLSELTISEGGEKKISASGKLELDRDHPLLELNLDRPEGKSRLFFKTDKKSDHHYLGELKAKWTTNGGGSLSIDNEVNTESLDNFYFKQTIDAPTFVEPGKMYFEISSKPAKGEAKKINFIMKGDDKVIASGSTNFNYKQEGEFTTLEGSGNLKYKDQSYPLQFQASLQNSENLRIGKGTLKAGKMSFTLENKITPEGFSFERVFCKEAKSCSKSQISGKSYSSVEKDEQSLIVLLDFSLMNPKLHDFSFKSEYKRDQLKLDHNVELQWSNDGKLSSHAFVHNNAAGMFVTLPKRTVGGQVKYNAERKDSSASLRLEAELHTNKGKEPKLAFIGGATTLYDKGAIVIAGEAKATHPTLGKDLVAKGQLSISDKPSKLVEGLMEVDVSPDPSNKFIGKLKVSGAKDNLHTLATLKSKGCHVDITYEEKVKIVLNGRDSTYLYSESFTYVDSKKAKREFLAKFEASSKRVYAILKAPEALFEADLKPDSGYTGNLNIFGKKYQSTLTYAKETNIFKYHLTGFADGKTLTAEAGGKIGTSGLLRAQLGEKKACSYDVALDEANFLRSAYSYDTEVLKNIYGVIANEAKLLAKEGQKSATTLYEKGSVEVKRLLDCLEKAKPNTKAFLDYYETQANQIQEELANDPTLKEASKLLKQAGGKFGEQFAVIVSEVRKLFGTICSMFDETIATLKHIAEEIEPKIKSSLQKLSKVFADLFEAYVKLSEQLVDLALDEIKKHQEDIDVFAKTFTDLLADIGKQIGQLVVTINAQIEELLRHNLESIQELPFVNTIREKWEEMRGMQLPEEVFNLVHEILESVKTFLPTSEATQFVTTLESVLDEVLKHQDLKNKDEVLKQLYQEFIAAVKSIIELVGQSLPQTGFMKPTSFQSLPLLNFIRIPSGSIRFSLFNFLTSKEYLPGIHEILNGIRISLNPIDNIPPFKGHAYIVGGTEIISFDGVHLSIPSSCSYLLTEDYRDRNFSVAAQISNGALKTLTVSNEKYSLEIRPNSNVAVNGKEQSFPVEAGELRAWKRPTSVGVWSDSGLLVICSTSLDSCSFSVSGFYFGRLRGLLGNLNGEQYDERLLPEGKIVGDTGSFADAWKLDSSCSIPSTATHKHTRISECTKFFTDEPLSLFCRPFVNPAPWRDACDHLAARTKEEGACLVAQAYSYTCRQQGVLISDLPDQCIKCQVNGKRLEAGESVQVSQGSSADVVLLVELSEDNQDHYKNIALPFLAALKAELGKTGVNDVRVMLLGASPHSQWPSFQTSQSGELAHEPTADSLHFAGRTSLYNGTLLEELREAESLTDKVLIVYDFINHELGRTSVARMYGTVVDLPHIFRPGSYRFAIGVHGRPCRTTPGSLAKAMYGLFNQELQGISYSVITPIAENSVVGLTETTKQDEKGATYKQETKPLQNVAVISEDDVLLDSGEQVKSDYRGMDVCVLTALEKGIAIADTAKSSIIPKAAAKLVQKVTAEKKTFDCECSTWKGVIAAPDCSVLDW